MMAAEVRWLRIVAGLIFIFFNIIEANLPHRRFEYKYSFKPPYLAQKDGSVPFWEYGGNAIASAENVRLAPSLRSQKGGIWTKDKTNFNWWEVDITFRITGRGRVGADGLAFWYTEHKGGHDGTVFGGADQWIGLAVIFDSFDNDNKHNNPYIMAMVNDGTRSFDHQNDGGTQMLAGCLRDFRNKPFPTRAKIEYYQNVLSISFHSGMTNNDDDFEVCMRAENVILPKIGYFGLTAATGGLADDHDILSFLTTSLHSPGQAPPTPGVVTDADQQKLAKEYEEYQRKLEQQQEEYRKEHPDENKEDEDWFETDQQRELRQIFTGQSQMFSEIRDIGRKLNEIIGRQESSASSLHQFMNSVTAGGVAIQPGQAGQQQPPPPPHMSGGGAPTINRHEVDSILNSQRELLNTARELRTYLVEIHQRSAAIIQLQEKQGTAHIVGGGSYDSQQMQNELRDGLNTIKRDVAAATQRLTAQPQVQCPSVSGCVSSTLFIIVGVLQVLVLVGYAIYRNSKESQAKKFY